MKTPLTLTIAACLSGAPALTVAAPARTVAVKTTKRADHVAARRALRTVNTLQSAFDAIGPALKALHRARRDSKKWKPALANARAKVKTALDAAQPARQAFGRAARTLAARGAASQAGAGEVAQLAVRLREMQRLLSPHQLGNHQLQDLMSRYNQASQLAASVFKKRDEADQALIGKI